MASAPSHRQRSSSPRVRDERFAVGGRLRQPRIVVADSNGRTPASARIYASEGGVQLERSEMGRVDLKALLHRLGAQEVNDLLVEAGPTLSGAFVAQQLWDELVLYLAPKFLGRDARPLADLSLERLADAYQSRVVGCELVGEDVRLTLERHQDG